MAFKMRYRPASLGLAFSLVFLPPSKESENWSDALSTKKLARETWKEAPTASSSSSKAREAVYPSRFQFNGVDRIDFSLSPGKKVEWEVSLAPIDYYRIWETGAWTGLSFLRRELHHFYTREHRRGPEPKYRVYTLSSDWEAVDFSFCSKREALLFEKSSALTQKVARYRLTRIKLLNSQELKREAMWELKPEAGQELLSVKSDNCVLVDLEGWPKSFRVSL